TAFGSVVLRRNSYGFPQPSCLGILSMYLGTSTFSRFSGEIAGTTVTSMDSDSDSASAFLCVASLRLGSTSSLYQVYIAVPTLRTSTIVCFCFVRLGLSPGWPPCWPETVGIAASARTASAPRTVWNRTVISSSPFKVVTGSLVGRQCITELVHRQGGASTAA